MFDVLTGFGALILTAAIENSLKVWKTTCMGEGKITGLEHLGHIRFGLAITVALFHLWPALFPDAGRHAVVGFFCISGFLITKIASETYFRRPVAFIINRFLRIYPVYWVCAAIILVIGLTLPDVQKVPNLGITVPSSLSMWATNVTLFSNGNPMLRIIPQTWSLQIEIVFYLILGLVTFRSEIITFAAFAISIIAGLASLAGYIPYPIYYSIPGNAFMFYSGAAAYFFLRRGVYLPRSALLASASAYSGVMFVLPLTVMINERTLVWLHSLLFASATAMFVILLSLPSAPPLSAWSSRLCRFMGRLAYPVFLLHFGFGALFSALFGEQTLLVGSATMVLTFIASVFVVRFVELPIEGLRSRTRDSERAAALVPP
jgi:peptidoglycan/LPS O-acetylase OafA/YrhL